MCVCQYVSHTRRSIILNLLIFFVIWLLTNSTYSSLEVLQSSINANLGITTISILYATKAISSLLGPFIVNHLSPKWTLVMGICLQMMYISANYYPEWYTMYLAGALMGFAIAPMWVCYGLYTTVLGVYYATVTQQNQAGVLNKFNGFVGVATPLAMIVGNFITSLVFTYISFDDDSIDISNSTITTIAAESTWTTKQPFLYTHGNFSNETGILMNDQHISVCNSHFCPQQAFHQNTTTNEDSNLPDQRVLYVHFTILLGVNLVALLLVILTLDNLPNEDIHSAPKVWLKCHIKVWSYIKAFFNFKYLLLIPSIAYMYMLLALLVSTFMKGYVTCSYGIELIGLVSMTLGIFSAIIGSLGGLAGQYIHRNYLFLLAFLTVLGALGIMALWDVMPYPKVMLHLVGGMIGAGLTININQFSGNL